MELLIASAVGFVLGIVGNMLATVWLEHYRTKRFGKYKGYYIQCDLKGQPLAGDSLWTRISDVKQGLLTTRGVDRGGGEWAGKILMNERFPGYGSGHYHYLSSAESDWGLHTIQTVDEDATILVQVQNISGGENKTYPLLWKKTPSL